MSALKLLLVFGAIYIVEVRSFATPFSELWTITKTFSSGGFEGRVRVPVQSSVTRGWKMSMTFDMPVKGLKMWRGLIDDVSPDFTTYDIINQPWSTYLHEGSTFEFSMIGYASKGLPSLKIKFQDKVHGEMEEINFSGSGSGSGSGDFGDAELWVDYDQVIGLSLLFFESKRSGRMPRDNRILWKHDSALYDGGAEGHNLLGGYYTGGDYVKFGFPMAFAITQLAWGALESQSGYEHSGEMGNLLKAIRWGTDYFTKAHVENNVLFGMVGDPGIDHGQWESAQNIRWRRPAYKLTKKDPGSDLAGETAAALAAASILFSSIDHAYTEELISHAEALYKFADKNRARYDAFSIPGARDFYPSSEYSDELVWAALWLYRATNKDIYFDAAIKNFDEFHLNRQSIERGLDYDNKILGIKILLTELTGDYDKYMASVYEFCDKWSGRSKTVTADGLLHNNKVTSAISFSANTGFVCALAAKLALDDAVAKKYRNMAENVIAEILGKGSKIGYMVGFGDNYPSTLHDRESSCPPMPLKCGWDFFNSPTPNTHSLTGALVGGPDKHGSFDDTRKNFVGNQPNILHNSAFQSLVAAMNSYHIGLSGLSVTPMTDDQLRAAVSSVDNLQSRFDACSSYPCENDGKCRNNNEGFGYECRCTENVFGRNCEFRLVPLLKWINKWNSGAEVHLELPDNRPPGEWQLRIRFPIGCPLQEIDIWNACFNVLDSSRERGELFVQQLGWQSHMNFIGIKFELGEKHLEHCFQDQSYNFLIIESGSTALTHRTPENCPRMLPHAYEGSGSGYSGDEYFGPPDSIETNVNVLLTPAPGSTLYPSPPPTTTPPPKPQVIVGSPELMLEWVSRWPYGGQGHIHVDKTRPNDKGDWILKLKFPSNCPLKGIKFWSACLVDKLSFPEEGIFVLEQVDWQIHQMFIGFAVHFSAGAVDQSVCYGKSSFEFIFTVNHLAHNLNVNYCPAQFKDIQSRNPSSSDSSRDKNPLYVSDSDTPAISSNKRNAERKQKVIPPVDQLHAEVLSDSSIEITWSDPSDDEIQVEIDLRPSSANEDPESNELNKEFVEAYSKHFTIPSSSPTYVAQDLTPGMKYKLTINFVGSDENAGPTSSLYITPRPNDIQNIHAVSLSGSSIHVTWNSPIGMHDLFRVMYAPEGNTGNPRSPFDVTGNMTSATIENLSTGKNFIIHIITKSGGEISNGAYTFTQTVPNKCTDISCGLNEICENDSSGPKCNCKIGFSGETSCSDIDECNGQVSCHEKSTCQNSVGSYQCVCNPGYTGDGVFCYDVNECEKGLATCTDRCVNTIGSYSCACPLGYTGSIDNCVDLDECANHLSVCPDDTACVNTVGSYSCACIAGYALVDSTCADIDECDLNTFSCAINTLCSNTLGSYECRCQKGFQSLGDSCEDIEECSLAVHSCHDHATCKNLIGGYECNCNSGYQGNGLSCADMDECAISHTCSPFASCDNSPGSYNCRCLAGYTGDGIICQDLLGLTPDPTDECALGTHTCDEHASCNNTVESYVCECLEGYTGDGTSCTDIDECAADIWLCSAISNTVCVNSPGKYSCDCKSGFTPNPTGCTDNDECTNGSNDCHVNGQCLNLPGSYACACAAGFVGDGKTCVPT